MKLTTEITEKKQKILIVGKHEKKFIKILKSRLEKHHIEVFVSPVLPNILNNFDHCFFLNEEKFIKKSNQYQYKRVTSIFIDQKSKGEFIAKYITENNLPNIKIINIDSCHTNDNDLDKILWFSLSSDKELYLNLITDSTITYHKPKKIINLSHFKFDIKRHKKKYLTFFICFFLLLQILFVPFLFLSSYFLYQSSAHIKKSQITLAEKNLHLGKNFFKLSGVLYQIPRPILSFLSLSIIPDNVFEINNKLDNVVSQTLETYKNAQLITGLIMQKNKSSKDQSALKLRFTKLKSEVDNLLDNLIVLDQKIPESIDKLSAVKKDLNQMEEVLAKGKKILSQIDYILGESAERKYLVLFANNMELRPGGGFIGSYGILTFDKYTLKDLQIYDVYDADGQLIAHVEPPYAIKTILNQPHWFLRDSAFSPDFFENYSQAKFFLDKEMNLKDFSGGILITTTAIQNILKSFGDIYMTDYKEIINSKNYYLKTQLYAEKDFFPGSIQKKTFLGSLARHILLNLDQVSPADLFSNIKKSLDEKQMTVYFDDVKVQSMFDTFSWSGRVVEPKCHQSVKNCVLNYLYPIDANLGVNKANFFVSKSSNLKVKVNPDGKIRNILSIKINNDSPNDVFPGGRYKNYFQLFLPVNANIKKITKNGTLVENYDEKLSGRIKIIGFLIEIPAKSSSDIKIDYELNDPFEKGRGIYQLTIQKQVGSFAEDLAIEIYLPKNIYLLNQNFNPLVKDNKIIYNTVLSSDKIFILELIRE